MSKYHDIEYAVTISFDNSLIVSVELVAIHIQWLSSKLNLLAYIYTEAEKGIFCGKPNLAICGAANCGVVGTRSLLDRTRYDAEGTPS